MRALLTCLLIAGACPAQAMNWEGHDDWMADQGPALLYRYTGPVVPEVRPPVAGCRPPAGQEQRNPYEQIPLKRPDCRAPQEEREVGR